MPRKCLKCPVYLEHKLLEKRRIALSLGDRDSNRKRNTKPIPNPITNLRAFS